MDKVTLEYKTPKNKIIEYNGVDIEVIPFMQAGEMAYLTQKYISDYFGTPGEILIENTKYHCMEAEYQLKNYIFNFKTNIDISNMDGNIFYADSELWNKITNEITNWYDFKEILETTVYDIKQQETLENSIGKVVSDLIQKGYALLDKLANMDIEEIKKIGEEGQKLIERLEKSSVLNNPADKVVIAENAGLVEVEEKAIQKATEIKTRKPRAKKAK